MRLSVADFAHHLRAIRLSRGLTQVELSIAIGRHRHTVAHWESGQNFRIRYEDVKKCAKALRCRVRDLIAPKEAPVPSQPADWPSVRRRIKRYVATLTGRRPRPLRKTRVRAEAQAQNTSGASAGGRAQREPERMPMPREAGEPGADLVAGLYQRVLAGELTWTEARAAAIEAGIRRQQATPSLDHVRSLLDQCSYEELQVLLRDMIGKMKGHAVTTGPRLPQAPRARRPGAVRKRCPWRGKFRKRD